MADNSKKISFFLGTRKGKFNSYLDQLWFEEVSKTSVTPRVPYRQLQTVLEPFIETPQDPSINQYVEAGYIIDYFE
jgi:hypothetical protein